MFFNFKSPEKREFGYKPRYYDAEREAFKIPAQITPMAMLAIGYEGDANNLPDDLKARELAERNRKPLGELFFNGTFNGPWQKPIQA